LAACSDLVQLADFEVAAMMTRDRNKFRDVAGELRILGEPLREPGGDEFVDKLIRAAVEKKAQGAKLLYSVGPLDPIARTQTVLGPATSLPRPPAVNWRNVS
jgi:hypothetical protein